MAQPARNLRGRVGRARAEWWVMRQLEQVRVEKKPATGALKLFAESDLDPRTAAIELLNVIRPTVAVARYITFCALALHEFPHTQELVASDSVVEPFVQEVRRFYPFFPAIAARVRRAVRLARRPLRRGRARDARSSTAPTTTRGIWRGRSSSGPSASSAGAAIRSR